MHPYRYLRNLLWFWLAFGLVLWLGTARAAETVRFSWTYEPAQEEAIEGFRVYERVGDERVLVMDGVPPSARATEIPAPDDGACHTYWAVAFGDGAESAPSNTAAWCAEVLLPAMIVRPVTPTTLAIEILP